MTKAANEIQQKVEEKFDGLTKEPSKAIQELLLVKSNKKTGKIKSRVYIRPYKATNRQVRGHWRKHNDKTVEKLLKKWLKKEPAAGKSKVETRLKTVLFQTEKIDEQWPWKWKFDKKGGKDTAAGYFGGAYDIQFFRFVAGARGEADFDLTDKKLTLGADAGISYGIADGSIKGEWGLPDQDGFNLYDHLLLSPKARESIKPNYECRFRFNIKTEGKLFAGVSLSAVVALPCIDFGDEKSGIFGGSVGGFAGGSAEGKLVTEIVWSKEKAAAFNLLAGFGGNAAGNVGIGAEGKFEFRYENGKVKFVSGAMLTYGIGAKAGLVFELDVNKAIELFSHIFRSVDWHKVDSVTLMAFEFYTNITFAKFIAAGKLGEYAFDKAKDFWGWFKDKRQHSKDINEFKNNIRVNINNAEELKNSPPETLGHLVLTIMETVESDDFDAIIKVLEAAESSHELKWILRNAQDKIKISSDSNDNDKGNALEEGIRRVIEFGLNNDSVSDKLEIYNRKIRTILKRNSIYYE